MLHYQKILGELLLITQFLACLAGLIYWKKIKHNYWKWFAIYLTAIFLLELFSKYVLNYYPYVRQYYYGFFVIPFEFLFFYWLYAVSSKKNIKLYWLLTVLYLLSFIPDILLFNGQGWFFKSFSYSVGNLFLAIMAIIEFQRQIKSDSILSFKTNMLFYVNAGVILFYIGTLPFFAFYGLLVKDISLWRDYYNCFILFNHLMYLLFTAAFIWGKTNTY